MERKHYNHLNKNEVGTPVPTSDSNYPSQKSSDQKPEVSKLDYHIPLFWPVIWVSLFLINIIFGLLAPDHDFLTLFRVGGIALCLIYVANIFPKDYLLLAAMFTTCISDIILALNNTSEIGLVFFLATQILHLFRLAGAPHYQRIAIFAGCVSLLIVIDLIFSIIPLLFLIAGFYAITLITNIVVSFRWHHAEPRNLRATFAFIGFTLFACCDICTGLSYLSLVAVLPSLFYAPANFFAWFFYYPSQVLISNSSKLHHDQPTKFTSSSGKYAIMNPKEGKC